MDRYDSVRHLPVVRNDVPLFQCLLSHLQRSFARGSCLPVVALVVSLKGCFNRKVSARCNGLDYSGIVGVHHVSGFMFFLPWVLKPLRQFLSWDPSSLVSTMVSIATHTFK